MLICDTEYLIDTHPNAIVYLTGDFNRLNISTLVYAPSCHLKLLVTVWLLTTRPTVVRPIIAHVSKLTVMPGALTAPSLTLVVLQHVNIIKLISMIFVNAQQPSHTLPLSFSPFCKFVLYVALP